MINERQKDILNKTVKEYICSAHPVSSQLLEKKYTFGLSPATIRTEMQKLTDKGFLFQPHISAGRVPTDRGYRFFVDDLLEKEFDDLKLEDWFENKAVDTIDLIQSFKENEWGRINVSRSLTKNLAHFSGAFALSYFKKEQIFWKEGWEEILKEPEFEQKEYIVNFTKLLEGFEENIGSLNVNSEIKVYIGKENPFKKIRDFSIIVSKCCLSDKEEGVISLLGPKRMDYDKNIGLVNSLRKLLEKI